MIELRGCDRCKAHTENWFTLYFMILPRGKDLGNFTFQDYKDGLETFDLCKGCKEFFERDFPSILTIEYFEKWRMMIMEDKK